MPSPIENIKLGTVSDRRDNLVLQFRDTQSFVGIRCLLTHWQLSITTINGIENLLRSGKNVGLTLGEKEFILAIESNQEHSHSICVIAETLNGNEKLKDSDVFLAQLTHEKITSLLYPLATPEENKLQYLKHVKNGDFKKVKACIEQGEAYIQNYRLDGKRSPEEDRVHTYDAISSNHNPTRPETLFYLTILLANDHYMDYVKLFLVNGIPIDSINQPTLNDSLAEVHGRSAYEALAIKYQRALASDSSESLLEDIVEAARFLKEGGADTTCFDREAVGQLNDAVTQLQEKHSDCDCGEGYIGHRYYEMRSR